MSIPNSLLALLTEEPKYGARLRSEFEARTGGSWPLNVGQVYTTLGRLERDGLVEPAGGADEEGRIAYRITDAGRDVLTRWWADPVARDVTPRNELAIKLALAVTVPGVDVHQVVQAQRVATMSALRALTRTKAQAMRDSASGGDGEAGRDALSWLLVVENLVFAAEAELRWLDQVEARVTARR